MVSPGEQLLKPYVQDSVFKIGLKSFEWTFTKRPLRRYEPSKHSQDTPIERRPSVSTALVDAFDLINNPRGVGWSWSRDPFLGESTPPPSTTLLLAKTLFKLTMFDASLYIVQRIFPSVSDPRGGSIFDPSLTLAPRIALAAFCSVCGGVWAYGMMDSGYYASALVGRIIFRQPAPPPIFFHRPWMSTSLCDFWNLRWHQLLRPLFIYFGARPGRALLGKPGAVMGAFGVSAIIHHVGMWGMGNGTEFTSVGGFFLLLGVGVIMEVAFTRATGLRVRGWIGWSWAMTWSTLWGTLIMDAWARHGMLANVFLPNGFRPGKKVVDAIIALSSK